MGVLEFDLVLGVLSVVGTDADGFVDTQIDAIGEGNSGVAGYETHYPDGLYGVPIGATLDGNGNPDPTTAHQVLVAMEGGKGHAFPLENPAQIKLLPNGAPGEKFLYGPKGQFKRAKVNGTWSEWAPPETAGGVASAFTWGPDVTGGGLEFTCAVGSVVFNADGFFVKHISGLKLEMGVSGGIPGASSANTSISLTGGTVILDAASVAFGADSPGGMDSPIPRGDSVLAYLTHVYTALQAIGAALVAGGTGTGVVTLPGAAPAMALIELVPNPGELLTQLYGNATVSASTPPIV